MKMLERIIAPIDKALERFDPVKQSEAGTGGLRSRYYDKTGVAKWREWRGVKDTLVDYGAWLNNLLSMAQMVASAPIPILKGFWEYRWMGSYLGTFMFIDRLFEGFRGPELKIAHMNMHAIVASLTKKIAFGLKNDGRFGGGPDTENIIPYDETISPLFLMGFKGLYPFPMQTLPEFIICDIDQHIEPYYIDVAESFGLPADVCSRCAAETGVALDDAFLKVGRIMLSTNMQHQNPEAIPYSRATLEAAIAFVEEHYGVKYDWDEFFKYAKLLNEQNTIELEKWDYFKTPYSALCGIAETLYRLYEWQSVNGQEELFNKNDRKVIEIMRRCYEQKHKPFGGKTRHRAFLWGPSAVYYCDFPTWIQNCWGINIVLNMDSTMGYNMIDTENPDKAMDDLTALTQRATMRHHAVGGWDNYNAVWDWAKRFNCDMVLMNDNIACNGTLGFHALMEEQARDLGFHFIFVEHDLQDSRTVSRQDMRNCVNNYMSVVLGEKPLDPTLLEFDDSGAY